MTRGIPPKPTALKILHGERPHRINGNEPKPASTELACPEDVADDVRGVFEFTRNELVKMNIASRCDRDTLIVYCEAVVNHRKASAILAKTNILIKGKMGGLVRNPALPVQYQAAQIIRAFAQEFGLTPSARTRIETGDFHNVDSNPFAASG